MPHSRWGPEGVIYVGNVHVTCTHASPAQYCTSSPGSHHAAEPMTGNCWSSPNQLHSTRCARPSDEALGVSCCAYQGPSTCGHKVPWKVLLRLAVLLAVEQGLWALWPIELPLQARVVETHIVEATAPGKGLPVPIVLPPLEPCSSGRWAEPGLLSLDNSIALELPEQHWLSTWRCSTCAAEGGALRVVGEARWLPGACSVHEGAVQGLGLYEQSPSSCSAEVCLWAPACSRPVSDLCSYRQQPAVDQGSA